MNSFVYKHVSSSELSADKYISVNNFGYYQDITEMKVERVRGRVDYQLIYVKSGELTVGQDAEACRLHDGSICLFRPYEPQIYSVNGIKTSYYWIHFSGREAEAMLSFFKKRSYHIGMLPEFEYYCHGPLEELNTAPEFAERLCEGRLIALMAKIAQKIHTDTATEKSMAMIRPALSAIHSDGGSQLTNEELSRLCNLSKSYFIKIFKDVMGTSPQQYHTALLVNKGCYLLTNSAYNVGEIARLCGIDDVLYFSRLFKKHSGLSPKDYRKKFTCI